MSACAPLQRGGYRLFSAAELEGAEAPAQKTETPAEKTDETPAQKAPHFDGRGDNVKAPHFDGRGDNGAGVDGGEDLVRLVSDEAVAAFRDELKGELILAPLTKGGNLPFRRLCADFGARVTVSEMAFARFLLKGNPVEKARLRRHGKAVQVDIRLTLG